MADLNRNSQCMKKEPVDGQVKQNKIRQRLGTFKIPSGTQSSSRDTKLAFMARSNYREKS